MFLVNTLELVQFILKKAVKKNGQWEDFSNNLMFSFQRFFFTKSGVKLAYTNSFFTEGKAG